MAIYGYARVSTMRQKEAGQVDNIKAYAPAAVIYEEKRAGADMESREVFRALLKS